MNWPGIDFHTRPVLVREMVRRHPGLEAAARERYCIGNTCQPLETLHLELAASGRSHAVALAMDARSSGEEADPVRLELSARRDQEHGASRASSRFLGWSPGPDLRRQCRAGAGEAVPASGVAHDPDDADLVLVHLERPAPKDPPRGEYSYRHNRYLDYDGRLGFNAGGHRKSILGGTQCFFPIENGRTMRGGRQRVYFVEYDGPLARRVAIQVLGEGE